MLAIAPLLCEWQETQRTLLDAVHLQRSEGLDKTELLACCDGTNAYNRLE
jgi:hypothetical protein